MQIKVGLALSTHAPVASIASTIEACSSFSIEKLTRSVSLPLLDTTSKISGFKLGSAAIALTTSPQFNPYAQNGTF